jgi:hypothetical protein
MLLDYICIMKLRRVSKRSAFMGNGPNDAVASFGLQREGLETLVLEPQVFFFLKLRHIIHVPQMYRKVNNNVFYSLLNI